VRAISVEWLSIQTMERTKRSTPRCTPSFKLRRLLPVHQPIHMGYRAVSGLRPALEDEPTSIDHLCRLTGVRCPIGRTRSQDRDGATTCGTCRAPTG
jgi:hypothetical protein